MIAVVLMAGYVKFDPVTPGIYWSKSFSRQGAGAGGVDYTQVLYYSHISPLLDDICLASKIFSPQCLSLTPGDRQDSLHSAL